MADGLGEVRRVVVAVPDNTGLGIQKKVMLVDVQVLLRQRTIIQFEELGVVAVVLSYRNSL